MKVAEQETVPDQKYMDAYKKICLQLSCYHYIR